MNLGELISIKTDDESSGKHTRYNEELRLFSCIQQGDINKLIEEMKNLNTSVTTGKLSDDGNAAQISCGQHDHACHSLCHSGRAKRKRGV